MPNQQKIKSSHAKSKGFTLIELVIVIVVLGILAATAVPKFINLRADSKAATLEAVKGTMESAMQLVYAKAVIESKATGEGEITINGTNVPLNNGYPTVNVSGKNEAALERLNAQLKAWLDIDSVNVYEADRNKKAASFYTSKSSQLGTLYIMFSSDRDSKSTGFKCQVSYNNNGVGVPEVNVLSEQC